MSILEELIEERARQLELLKRLDQRIHEAFAEDYRQLSLMHRIPTEREQEVLTLIRARKCNKEIAAKLHMSVRTVKFHVSNLLVKYKVDNRHLL